MPSLPALDIKTGFNHSPHIVLLGAGASCACCPQGDRAGKKLPVMANLVETLGLNDIIESCGLDPSHNFEKLYGQIHKSGNAEALEKLDTKVRQYFSQLALPDTPMLYDYLVLSLRPKDAIVTFNWDPLLPQAFKRWRHLGNVLPRLIFLHGNIDIGIDLNTKVSGFMSDEPYAGRKLVATPLLYPVEEKKLQ